MKKNVLTLTLFGVVLLLTSCTKKSDFNYYYYSLEDQALLSQYLSLPLEIPDEYVVTFPNHLRNIGLFPRPVERDKAILGRVLFYDKKLSKDGTIACASCHKQAIGFSDDKKVSLGVYGRVGERNSIALGSVANFSAYYGTDLNGSSAIPFFWDNRAPTATKQSEGSLTNHLEMDMQLQEVAAAVQQQDYYQPLFKKAFGNTTVTQDRVLEAIANFVNAMGSYQSKFDKAASESNIYYVDYNTDFNDFTAQENRGKQVYMANCKTCHSENQGRPVLLYANNGLEAVSVDEGVGGKTGVGSQLGTFKVPTLRNITLTAPYMHDGRFSTLDEVVEHYSTGIQNHPNLHPFLKGEDGKARKMNISADDKEALIAFLGTLKDDVIITDTKFSNPFK